MALAGVISCACVIPGIHGNMINLYLDKQKGRDLRRILRCHVVLIVDVYGVDTKMTSNLSFYSSELFPSSFVIQICTVSSHCHVLLPPMSTLQMNCFAYPAFLNIYLSPVGFEPNGL